MILRQFGQQTQAKEMNKLKFRFYEPTKSYLIDPYLNESFKHVHEDLMSDDV